MAIGVAEISGYATTKKQKLLKARCAELNGSWQFHGPGVGAVHTGHRKPREAEGGGGLAHVSETSSILRGVKKQGSL